MSTPVKLFGAISSWEDTPGSRGLEPGVVTHQLELADTESVDVEIFGSAFLVLNTGVKETSGIVYVVAEDGETAALTVMSDMGTSLIDVASGLGTDEKLNIADNGNDEGIITIENQVGSDLTIRLVAIGKA